MPSDIETRLAGMQRQMRELRAPVIILFEGWDAAGKGALISALINCLDPRGYKVYTPRAADERDARYPLTRRYWQMLPARGEIAIFDKSWYREVIDDDPDDSEQVLEEIRKFERQLEDDGYYIIKIFLNISEGEQMRRLESLAKNPATRWRVTKSDLKNNKRYKKLKKRYDAYLEPSWQVLDASDFDKLRDEALERIYTLLRLLSADHPERREEIKISNACARDALGDVDLSLWLDEDEYKSRLKRAKKRLFELHNLLYQARIPVVIGFEGWDAAGKGGAIKRLSSGLDPRGAQVFPIAAPTKDELSHHYLWRFYNRLPKDGHIAIFDRTWYGRVMVERVEGLAGAREWGRAYNEINEFEETLTGWGAIVVKFFLHIDKDEQLRRFNERKNDPGKQWKLTDEDWRNREKWDVYYESINEMLALTNKEGAPWVIVPAQDKKFARVFVLETLVDMFEKRLEASR